MGFSGRGLIKKNFKQISKESWIAEGHLVLDLLFCPGVWFTFCGIITGH
jgi:hypothetical protein